MTALVIELRPGLKKLPQSPGARRERAKDAVFDAYVDVRGRMCRWLGKSPVLLIRRSELGRRQLRAFDLGREVRRVSLMAGPDA